MKRINQWIQQLFPHVQPLPAGVYHYQAPPESEFPYRLHLRIEKDGTSALILNASTILHLNETATEYTYHIIRETAKEEVIRSIGKRYNVKKEQVLQDFDEFQERLKTLISTPDLDPVTFLDIDRKIPYSTAISAPYRLDCALTYTLADGSSDKNAPMDRVIRELSVDEWKTIFLKAWEAGIPHLIFTGGEPTLRPDLPDLIAYAESIGQVTGLLTDGIRLAEKSYLQRLLLNGLDHLMVILDPDNEVVWKALETIMPEDIFTTVHLTITSSDFNKYKTIVDRLNLLGVQSISLSADNPSHSEVLQDVRNYLETIHTINLVWDLPVPYSKMNPVFQELAKYKETSEGAGKAWLYVEPDGDILAAQGMTEVLGNMLTDPWEKIWK